MTRSKAPQALSIIAALWATAVALFFLFGPVYETSTSEYSVTVSSGQVATSPERVGHTTGLHANGPNHDRQGQTLVWAGRRASPARHAVPLSDTRTCLAEPRPVPGT